MINLRKISTTLIMSLVVASCGTMDNFRDGFAGMIETEGRATQVDRVQHVPTYIPIPNEFLDNEACPPPVYLTPEEIARITTEGRYNEYFVAPLYSNNEDCYLNTRRLERYNDARIIQYQQPGTGESKDVNPK